MKKFYCPGGEDEQGGSGELIEATPGEKPVTLTDDGNPPTPPPTKPPTKDE